MKKNVLFMILAASVLYSCNINEVSNQNSANEISIYGNVIGRASGSPLYNVMIELFKHNEENDSDDKVLGSTVTGNDGNYEFTVALDRTAQYDNDAVAYYVRASKDKYTTSLYKLNLSNVDKSNRIKVDFQITVTSIIYAGKVTDTQKKPLVDAKIKAKYYSANSDEDHVRDYGYAIGTTVITDYNGEYKFEVPIPTNNSYLPQWQYLIYAEKDGYITAEHFVNQNVEDMGRNITLNFTMKSVEEQEEEDLKKNYVTIYGKVTDNNGKPILNATIEDWLAYNNSYSLSIHYSTIQTDAQGKYEILSPIGLQSNYSYYSYHSYYCEAEGYGASKKTLHTTDGDAGNSYNFDFVLYRK